MFEMFRLPNEIEEMDMVEWIVFPYNQPPIIPNKLLLILELL